MPQPQRQPEDSVEIAGVTLSSSERVLFPDQGLSKRALAEFYRDIADQVLPHVVGRPLSLLRCPRGREQHCFFQKHYSDSMAEPIEAVTVQEKHKTAQYPEVEDLAGLVALVQLGVLELHPAGARSEDQDHPDRLVFDLDPGAGTGLAEVVQAARDVRELLEEHGLTGYVRTSGGKGLHVVIPLRPTVSWDQAKDFARGIAETLSERHPKRYVATMSKTQRKGRVFIDYLRNSKGATAIAGYSTRARPGAPVATPLGWDELDTLPAADHYTVTNLRERLAALEQDPWAGFFEQPQELKP